MQVQFITKEQEEFEPITLKITIETEAELRSLWMRLKMNILFCDTDYPSLDPLLKLWSAVTECADKLDLEEKYIDEADNR